MVDLTLNIEIIPLNGNRLIFQLKERFSEWIQKQAKILCAENV